MSDKDKFEGFKQKLVEENERIYGKEARAKYGMSLWINPLPKSST